VAVPPPPPKRSGGDGGGMGAAGFGGPVVWVLVALGGGALLVQAAKAFLEKKRNEMVAAMMKGMAGGAMPPGMGGGMPMPGGMPIGMGLGGAPGAPGASPFGAGAAPPSPWATPAAAAAGPVKSAEPTAEEKESARKAAADRMASAAAAAAAKPASVKVDAAAAAGKGKEAGVGGGAFTGAATAPKKSTKGVDELLDNPEMQKMIYPYLPEHMRNPETFKWMLQNPEMRQQMEEMMAGTGGENWEEAMRKFSMDDPAVKAQFEALGTSPDEVMAKMMADPEIATAFANPRIQSALLEISQDQSKLSNYANDEEVMRIFSKMNAMFMPGSAGAAGPAATAPAMPGVPDMNDPTVKAQFDALGTNPQELMQKMMQDPELVAAMMKPNVSAALMDVSQNPMNMSKYAGDAEVMGVLNKMQAMVMGGMTPPAGMPPAGMPPAGMPPAGMPPAGMPPAGMPAAMSSAAEAGAGSPPSPFKAPNLEDPAIKAQLDAAGLNPQEMMSQMMADPEMVGLMMKPEVQAALMDVSQNPANTMKYAENADVMKVMEKMNQLAAPAVAKKMQETQAAPAAPPAAVPVVEAEVVPEAAAAAAGSAAAAAAPSPTSGFPPMGEGIPSMDDPTVKAQFDAMGTNPQELMQKMMQDPELVAAMMKPNVSAALMDVSQNPMNMSKYAGDAEVMGVLNKMQAMVMGGMGTPPGQ